MTDTEKEDYDARLVLDHLEASLPVDSEIAALRDRLISYDALATQAREADETSAAQCWERSAANPDVCRRIVGILADLAPEVSDA